MRAALAVLLIVPGAACAGKADDPPPTQTSTNRAMAERLPDGRGLSHVARISDGLYRGSQPTEEGYKALKEMGVKTVVTFRVFNSYEKEAKAAGLEQVRIPIHASIGSTPPTEEQVKRFFEVVLDPEKQPVYIHCKHGKDRTGTMAALYRMEVDGWTAGEAIEEMQAFGYHDLYKDLIAFVRSYTPHGFK